MSCGRKNGSAQSVADLCTSAGMRCCGGKLTYIPAQYKVVEHVQTAYGCRCCERTNDHVPMKKCAVPPALLPDSGVVSPSLPAHILHSKYVLALPLYRQAQEFQRAG